MIMIPIPKMMAMMMLAPTTHNPFTGVKHNNNNKINEEDDADSQPNDEVSEDDVDNQPADNNESDDDNDEAPCVSDDGE